MGNIPRTEDALELTGAVTDGKGEGKYFIALEGYAEQFESKLGYTPFPGTLNLDLTSASTERRTRLDDRNPTCIEAWEDGESTYGAVACYPARLIGAANTPAHVLVPKRTDHDLDQLEIVSPVKLREAYDLDDGDQLTVRIGDHQ